jgi:hypothetical protein
MTMRFSAMLALAGVGLLCSTARAAGRTHDGFYLRLGAGFGYTSDRVEGNVPNSLPSVSGDVNVKGTVRGGSGASEIAFGGTVGRGLVLGGGIWSVYIASPIARDVEVAGVDVGQDIEFDDGSFHVIAPFIDYYFDPHGGFHLQAGLGIGVLTAGNFRLPNDTQVSRDHTALGLGGMFGLGYEWWVGDSWGLGFVGRVTGGFLSGTDDNDIEWKHTLLAPAALFTATMN